MTPATTVLSRRTALWSARCCSAAVQLLLRIVRSGIQGIPHVSHISPVHDLSVVQRGGWCWGLRRVRLGVPLCMVPLFMGRGGPGLHCTQHC